jgi:hypothetical protein
MKDFLQVEAEKVFLARSQKYIHDKYRVITTQRIKIAKRRGFFLFYFLISAATLFSPSFLLLVYACLVIPDTALQVLSTCVRQKHVLCR